MAVSKASFLPLFVNELHSSKSSAACCLKHAFVVAKELV